MELESRSARHRSRCRLTSARQHSIADAAALTGRVPLRSVAVGRKNYLFAGSDHGSERAAVFYTLIETAKLNGLDPEAYLRDVLTRIADHSAKRLAVLLPWNWMPLNPLAQAA